MVWLCASIPRIRFPIEDNFQLRVFFYKKTFFQTLLITCEEFNKNCFKIVYYIIKSRSEYFCAKSRDIEDRDEVEVGKWAKHKKTLYSLHTLYGNYLWNEFSNFKTDNICRKC
jgi:hypothetical protein